MKYLARARENGVAAWPSSFYHEDLIPVPMLNRTMFVVNNPTDVQWVMVTNAKNYQKSPATRQTLKPLLGNGIFVSERELWTRQRQVLTPAVHKSRLKGYGETILLKGTELLRGWESHGDNFELDMTEEMSYVAADVISRIMFSEALGERVKKLYEAFKEYQKSHGRIHLLELIGLPGWLPRPGKLKGRKAVRKFDEVILEIIANRRNGGVERDDFLNMLLSFRDGNGNPMDSTLVRDEVASIFLAGHETTATTLTWAFYLLNLHPEVERKIHEEIDRVLGDRPLTYEDVAHLIYTRAVIDETLRLYPPVHVFSRQAIGEDVLSNNVRVPPRSFITIASWVLHRHKKYWEEPDNFLPERFLPENAHQIHQYAYIPFGAGPRICPGKHLGLLEAVSLLAMIARTYRLRLREGHPVEPLGRMTLRPRWGMPMKFTRRR